MATRGQNEILLQKRPPSGIWGGLWSFPELESVKAIDNWCMDQLGAMPAAKQSWRELSHSFSHFEFVMQPVEVHFEPDQGKPGQLPLAGVMEDDRWLWYNTRSPASVGLAAPVAQLLKQLDQRSGEQK